MFLSNFPFIRFNLKGHFQGPEFFLTDRPTDPQTDRPTYLIIEIPCPLRDLGALMGPVNIPLKTFSVNVVYKKELG